MSRMLLLLYTLFSVHLHCTIAQGVLTTIAGSGILGDSGDGGAATAATLSAPSGVAVDAVGNVYIADRYNKKIRKVTVSTGIITTFAGVGYFGFSGDGGAATLASLDNPYDVVLDALGTYAT